MNKNIINEYMRFFSDASPNNIQKFISEIDFKKKVVKWNPITGVILGAFINATPYKTKTLSSFQRCGRTLWRGMRIPQISHVQTLDTSNFFYFQNLGKNN